MKYIPGMRFINNTRNNTKLFERNKLYILQDIKKNEKGQVSYTFVVDDKLKEVKFESFSQAENWLSTIVV
jgi:hypothetical protein